MKKRKKKIYPAILKMKPIVELAITVISFIISLYT